jgi:N-acyl-phosphatidylethanolamine-hydrolysing phospholipase D
MKFNIFIILVSFILVTSCTSQTQPVYQNTSGKTVPSFFKMLAWRFKRMWNSSDTTLNYPILKPDIDYLQKNHTEQTITWLGHSTLLLQVGGKNILTDPILTNQASPVSWAGPKRVVPSALSLHQLPPIDYVFISHNHYDHLDVQSVKFISDNLGRDGQSTQFFVPKGLKTWFLKLKIKNVREFDWWQSLNQGNWTIHATPVQHHSGRGLFDMNKTLWAGWSIQYKNFKFFFAGDTGYSSDFKTIGNRLGPFNLAAIPIGAYSPRKLMKITHVSPEEALQIHLDIGSKHSIAIHWGTFADLTDEPLSEPPQRLRQALINRFIPLKSFESLKHGETRIFQF